MAMKNTEEILNHTGHRQSSIPEGPWKYYQEWHDTFLIHWTINPMVLQAFIPSALNVDTFNGQAWVSLVAFSVKKMRLRNLPAFPLISNFHQINLRTYVTHNGIPGIYFITIEASKFLSIILARNFTGQPYTRTFIKKKQKSGFTGRNKLQNHELRFQYLIKERIYEKNEIDLWLTERYTSFHIADNKIVRTDIHHKEWPLHRVIIKLMNVNYPVLRLLPDILNANLVHYSPLLKTVTWKGKAI